MRKAIQFAVEVHFVTVSTDELAERSRNLCILFLRGARRDMLQKDDRTRELGTPKETTSRPDLVEK